MKVLVITGECIQVNSSVNLCNIAYLQGLVDTGNEVTLLSLDAPDYKKDPSMRIPKGVVNFSYKGITLYERLSEYKVRKKNTTLGGFHTKQSNSESVSIKEIASKRGMISKLKKMVLSLYGVHGIYGKFAHKAFRYRSSEVFDLVLSLATPASSHLLAEKLIKSKHIKCRRWIQVWEDPWYLDVVGYTKQKKVYREEKRLLSVAERICYVSPITLEYQKKVYPDSADKMFWVPLPSYYKSIKVDFSSTQRNLFGYFGEYSLPTRDLRPFYEAAQKTGIDVNICGNSNIRLKPTNHIHIHPRLDLKELKPIEDKTEVLVFLCNTKGGQIPGKIYQYAATNKTVLFILDGTEAEIQILHSYFEPLNRFVFCRNNSEDIERAFGCIRSGDLGKVKNDPISEFTPEKIIRSIIELGMR